MGFEPTTFLTIGPQNIYVRDTRHKVVILFYSILFLLLLEMLVEQESFLWSMFPALISLQNWNHQTGRGGLGTN